MQNIIDNIYLLKSTFSISHQFITTFKVFVALIATDLRGNTINILSSIQSLGFKNDDLKHIFITHADEDHYGYLSE